MRDSRLKAELSQGRNLKAEARSFERNNSPIPSSEFSVTGGLSICTVFKMRCAISESACAIHKLLT